MNTAFLLAAQYGARVIIPLEQVRGDYFSHLTLPNFKIKLMRGDINLPLVAIESSQKSALGIHLNDLAAYLDAQHAKAKSEHEKLTGGGTRRTVKDDRTHEKTAAA